jgi:transketolase
MITPAVPEMIGGSADLTGSNNTKTKSTTVLSAKDYPAASFITACASTAWLRP